MARRTFLGAVATGAAIGAFVSARTSASGPADSTRDRPWHLRASEAPLTSRSTVFDARTGTDVGRDILLACCRRLERSRITGCPVRIVLFRRNAAGQVFVVGDRIATEPAWVQVTA